MLFYYCPKGIERMVIDMNFWLGNEELIIRWGIGTFVVLSSREDGILFTGSYEKCLDFCHNREEAYEMMNF